jgi:Zn-dependent protease with chaperone function
MNPEARAWRAAAPFALVPAFVLGLALGLWVSAVAGLIAAVAVAVALGAWARLGGDRRVGALVGGREANPREDARLWNLVEGLSISAGVRQPRLRVVESPGLNVMAAGSSPSRGMIAVTTGLLTELNRIELEAVIAEQLVRLRHRETLPGTVLVALFGLGHDLALAADMDARADQLAVSLTRYPPALASALEKMEAKGTEVAGSRSYLAHLWMAEPTGASRRARGRLPLGDRIEALREL